MSNPEKGPGKLGHEGNPNQSYKPLRDDTGVAKSVGKAALKGTHDNSKK